MDIALGFPNKISSTVKKTWQGFDQLTREHVFVLQYRIKVKPGMKMQVATGIVKKPKMPLMRPLASGQFARALKYSESTRSPDTQ